MDTGEGMYLGYKVVVVTPAGRERYMEILERYIFQMKTNGGVPIVDRWDIWMNTNNTDDQKYLLDLPNRYNARIIESGLVGATKNICKFWKHATDEDTIYIRMDDDIVWTHASFVFMMAWYRVQYPEPFLISASVLNNAMCSYIWQRAGEIKWPGSAPTIVKPDCLCRIGWSSPEFAEYLHRDFLQRRWLVGNNPAADYLLLNYERFSINAVCWFGKDCAEMMDAGEMPADEEEYVTMEWPRKIGRPNMIASKPACAHFAYWPQREYLDRTDILAQYKAIAP